jgi:hypothetical protein
MTAVSTTSSDACGHREHDPVRACTDLDVMERWRFCETLQRSDEEGARICARYLPEIVCVAKDCSFSVIGLKIACHRRVTPIGFFYSLTLL